MHRIKIYKRAAVAVAATAATGFGIMIGVYQAHSVMANRAEHGMRIRLALSEMDSALVRASANNNAYIISRDQQWLVFRAEAVERTWDNFAVLAEMAGDDEVQEARLEHLKTLVTNRISMFDAQVEEAEIRLKTLTQGQEISRWPATTFGPGTRLAREIRVIIDQLHEHEEAVVKRRIAMTHLAYIIIITTILVEAGTFIWFARWTYRRLHDDILTEKDLADGQRLLVKELNHRVKNSLQTVASVLRLQSLRLTSDAARDALGTAINRVNAIANVHKSLYDLQSTNLPAMGFIEELLDAMQKAAPVEIHTNLREVTINLDYAVPLALLLNELLTNAVKYGHQSGQNAVVDVKFGPLPGKEDTHWYLQVSDQGPGYPPGFDPIKSQGLGHKLIRGLTQQLGAEDVTYTNDGGACFRMVAVNSQKTMQIGGSDIADRR
jgi:two-component sensor histidine kinase